MVTTPETRRPTPGTRSLGVVAATVVGVVGLSLVPTASAHEGTAHAGTPHAALLGMFVIGVAALAGSLAVRERLEADRLVAAGIFLGAILALLGAIGLVEVQIEPLSTDATPVPRTLYPLVGVAAGGALLLASVNLGVWRWPDRPEYAALGTLLGAWVCYPFVVPGGGYFNPLGHLIVVAVPIVVGYVLWRDVRPAVAGAGRRAMAIGWAAAGLFTAFVLFSTGQFTLNPEPVVTDSGRVSRAFLVFVEFRDPLVVWPAVEFYLPSVPGLGVPLFGALNVGTVVTVGLLTGLVWTNAVLAATGYRSEADVETTGSVLGGVATTGATACCCCAPALYAVLSGVLGASASPLYWAFLDSSSPLGALFFVAAVILMTASAVRQAHSLGAAGVCPVPARTTV